MRNGKQNAYQSHWGWGKGEREIKEGQKRRRRVREAAEGEGSSSRSMVGRSKSLHHFGRSSMHACNMQQWQQLPCVPRKSEHAEKCVQRRERERERGWMGGGRVDLKKRWRLRV